MYGSEQERCHRRLTRVRSPLDATVFEARDTTLVEQLADLREVEQLGLRLLELGSRVTADPGASQIYAGHAIQTRGHLRMLEERLLAHDAAPQPPTGRVRGGVLDMTFDPDRAFSAAELAVAAYTLENLEIGLYHLLCGLASQAHDHETEIMAQQILEQEESAAELFASRLHRASVSRPMSVSSPN